MQIDGNIKDNVFGAVIREYLQEFTDNERLLDEATWEICRALMTVKYPRIRTVFNKDDDYNLRVVSDEIKEERRRLLFQFVGQNRLPKIESILQMSDFGLANRVELVMLAVLGEMGFGEFSRNVRQEIQEIQKSIDCDLQIYKQCIHDIAEHTIYITNRTYGALYRVFYNNILITIIDKL